MNENQIPRRQFLKAGGAALAMISGMMILPGPADAATNATLRASLKYQSTPQGEKNCASCIQFVPGASVTAPGGCKILPGDTEISPQGYCLAWAKRS